MGFVFTASEVVGYLGIQTFEMTQCVVISHRHSVHTNGEDARQHTLDVKQMQ